MFLHKTPLALQWLYPSLVWKVRTQEKCIYLTFDDGPIPELTPWVLDQLQNSGVKATFFCVGHNVEKYPDIFQRIVNEGHSVGSHTYHHLNGWKTPVTDYFENAEKARLLMKSNGIDTFLFRPPYGRVKKSQIKALEDYQIIMWDVLTGDFDQNLESELILKRSIEASSNGSIVVFHDNLKAEKNLREVLPAYLDHFKSAGFSFCKL